jgi:hypothetical protein
MRGVASIDSKILHAQTADGRHHPAILAAVIVDAANLPGVPADSHHFEKFAFVNQVSRVVALGVKKIRGKRLRLNRFLSREIKDSPNGKLRFGDGAKLLYPFVDRKLFHRRASQHDEMNAQKTESGKHYSNSLHVRQQETASNCVLS